MIDLFVSTIYSQPQSSFCWLRSFEVVMPVMCLQRYHALLVHLSILLMSRPYTVSGTHVRLWSATKISPCLHCHCIWLKLHKWVFRLFSAPAVQQTNRWLLFSYMVSSVVLMISSCLKRAFIHAVAYDIYASLSKVFRSGVNNLPTRLKIIILRLHVAPKIWS